jgi:hypothetical protein
MIEAVLITLIVCITINNMWIKYLNIKYSRDDRDDKES